MKNYKKYKMLDAILLSLKAAPIQTALIIVIMTMNAFLPTFQVYVTANFVDTTLEIFNRLKKIESIFPSIIFIMCIMIFSNILPSIEQIVEISRKNSVGLLLKKIVILKTSGLEYKHIENNDTQELINRVNDSLVDNFSNGAKNILNSFQIFTSVASLLLIVMSVSIFSGLLMFFLCIPLLYIAMRVGKKNYKMGIEAKKVKRRYNYLAEILTNRKFAQERKLFSFSKPLSKKYDSLYDETYKIESSIIVKSYANMKIGSLIYLLVILLIICLLLPQLERGLLTIGLFVGLTNAVFGLVQTMSWQLSGIIRNYSQFREYIKDFNKFINLSEKKDACVMPEKLSNFNFKSLEFRKISFKYPNTERYILKNCSFVMLHDKKYAFVGENGAGKTTITKLLTGLYDEYEGDIFINDKNIKEYSFAEIKSLSAVVFQDFSKFPLTIKENISLGNILDRDDERLHKSVVNSGLFDLISGLEQGIDTYVGKIKDKSIDLSGGEWQRIAISRLLYADSIINILDEPTAALDPIAESNVYEMFNKINSDKFVIYITHRLGAAKMADEILVVDSGSIIEQGSHEKLISIPYQTV